MVIGKHPTLRFLAPALLTLVTLGVLVAGYAFLRDFQGSKVVLTLGSIIWGVVSVGLLYTSLNALGEVLPRKARQLVIPLVFVGPALVLLFWFLVIPVFRTLGFSFMDATSTRFVGFENYRFAFTDRSMLQSFGNNLLWVVLGSGATVVTGLLIAVLADRSKAEKIYKAIIFMPMAISFVGAGVIWKFMYAYKGEGAGVQEIGLLNAVVMAFGGESQPWLLLPFWNNIFLILIMVWLQSGYAMVILSSAIKAIPEEHLEAARVDGASELIIFFRITIPSIMGTLITVTTTVVIFSLKLFDIVRVMTGGNYGTNVIANEFYLQEFTYNQNGRAAAIAMVLLVAIIPVLVYNIRQFAERKAFK